MSDALLRYVEEQLKKGIRHEFIRDRLVRQGYSPALVEGIIESVQMNRASGMSVGPAQEQAAAPRKSALPIIVLALIFIGLMVVGVIFVPGLLNPKTPLLDIEATPDKISYVAGESVGFDVEIANQGSKEEFDVNLMYKLIDKNQNTLLTSDKTKAVSTSTSYHQSVTLPSTLIPGTYTIRVFANYEGKVATTSFQFDVVEKIIPQASCYDSIRNQDEVGVDCGGVCGGYWYDGKCNANPKPVTGDETCNDGKMNQDEVGVDCGGVCGGYWYDASCHSTPKPVTPVPKTQDDIIMEANTLVKTNPEGAKNLCLGLETNTYKDRCLDMIAHASNKSEYCDLITDSIKKDSCYYYFFANGDYSVCEKLTDPTNKKNCEDLREIDLIKKQLDAGNNEAAAELADNSGALNYFDD